MEKLLFTNVMLYDGTGRTPFMADVAVQDDRIAAVAECGTLNKTGVQVIDGKGLALTPGFVDVHTHSDSSAARVPGGDSKISQGVTTDISGNCGFSFYLTGAKDAEDVFKGTWCNFGAYADAIEKSCPAVNVVHLCGHNSLRVRVMGYEERNATREELRQMKELLAEALEHGAGGFSGGPYYLPGKFAPTEELKELASLLKGTGKPYATHIRSEASNLLEALDEAFEIARAGDNNLEISHLKTSGEKNWCKLDAVFEKIEKAYDIARNSKTQILNLTGFMIKAIRDGYSSYIKKETENGNSFNNFHQREYDFNTLEKKLLMNQLLRIRFILL